MRLKKGAKSASRRITTNMNKFLSIFIIFNMFLINCTPVMCEQNVTTLPDEKKQTAVSKVANKADKTSSKAQKDSAAAEKKVAFKLFKKKKNEPSEEQKREAKTFALFKKKEKKSKAKTKRSDEQQNQLSKQAAKEQTAKSDTVKKDKPKKEKKKKEDKYAEYSIPIDAYMPVGNSSDKSITISGSVQKTLELNLADCLELALINNPKVKAAYANAEVLKYKKNQTLSNYSPVVNLQGGISRIKPDMSNFRSRGIVIDPFTKYVMGSIGISQLVYDFGLTQNQYTIDKLNWESSKSNIDSVVNQVVCQVKDGYYNLIYAIEAKRVAQETLEQFEAMYNQALAFYEVGTKPKVDVTIAQVNMEDARAKLISASNNVDIAISNLNNLMGLPFIPPYIIDTSSPFQDVDIDMRHAVEIANEARPELKIAKINVEAADQAVRLAKKTYFPSLNLSANYSIGGVNNTIADTNWWDFGGYLTFPAVNPFLIRNQIKEARAQLEKQKFDSKATVNDIYYDIQSTFVKLVDAKQRVPVAKLAVKKAKENYELSQGRYRVGVSDAIEYKEAQIQYYDARLAYLNTIYQFNSAKANLERAIGQTLPGVESPDEEGI